MNIAKFPTTNMSGKSAIHETIQAVINEVCPNNEHGLYAELVLTSNELLWDINIVAGRHMNALVGCCSPTLMVSADTDVLSMVLEDIETKMHNVLTNMFCPDDSGISGAWADQVQKFKIAPMVRKSHPSCSMVEHIVDPYLAPFIELLDTPHLQYTRAVRDILETTRWPFPYITFNCAGLDMVFMKHLMALSGLLRFTLESKNSSEMSLIIRFPRGPLHKVAGTYEDIYNGLKLAVENKSEVIHIGDTTSPAIFTGRSTIIKDCSSQ